MITRFIPLLLLNAFLLATLPGAVAGPTIQLIVASYDYTPAEANFTIARAIANDRTIVGGYASSRVPEAGYLRLPNGRFSRPIIVAGANFTTVSGINDSGLVCGSFLTAARHGFFFDGATYTQFDLPGNVDTYVEGENDMGDFVGVAIDAQGMHTEFISVGGVITTFTIPGISDVSPTGINNLGQVAGHYSSGNLEHGFFRDTDGTLTYPIDYPFSGASTEILGLNDQGLMVGTYNTPGSNQHAFVLQNRTNFISYDHPDAAATFFGGINNSRTICGYYSDVGSLFSHAFIARLDR